MNKIELSIPLSKEAIISARLVATAIATHLNLSVDEAEDVKVLASEGLNLLSACSFLRGKIEYIYEKNLQMNFFGEDNPRAALPSKEETFISKMLIEGLSKSSSFDFEQGKITIMF